MQVHNAPGAEVGPGQVASWGRATADRANGFGFKWELDGTCCWARNRDEVAA